MLAITATVAREQLHAWWRAAFAELEAVLHAVGGERAGAPGGIYDQALFEDELGECTAYLPLAGPLDLRAANVGRGRLIRLPERPLALAVQTGPHRDVDLVYAALGTHVTDHQIDGGGPVYERYLTSELDGSVDSAQWRTEVGWPISASAA